MAMSPQSAVHLVSQLQQAHRISVAFYRRILPTLDFVASELGCAFDSWKPLHTSQVRGKNRPSTTWAWDYIPLFASNHIYSRVRGEHTQRADLQLCLSLYVDDGFTPEARKRHGISGQPDAITLPVGKAVLQAWIYRPIAPSESAFDKLVANAADPEIGLDRMQEVSENVQAIAFEWPLAEVMQDVAPMLSILKQYAG